MKRVEKGWGYELWIHNSEKYCGKLLYFNKNKSCSFHYHKIKEETFYVQSGKICLLWSDDLEKHIAASDFSPYNSIYHEECNRVILNKGDSFHIPPGRLHQMIALEDTELFEFSTQHFDEDSYRLLKGD